jgi:hypothetical protein
MTEPRGFAWVLNLDAELELEKPSFNARTRFLEQLALYGAGSRALLGPRDVLLGEEKGGTDVAGRLGRAWCPTPRALARMRAARVTPEPHPPVEILRLVNHRRFAHELGGGLPDQHYVERRPELEALLARREHPWLLKRPLAFAGRGQQRAYGSLDEKQWSWVDASFKVSGLVVEPLVIPALEVSLHGFIWREGRYELGRTCVQEVSDRGVFRGIRLAGPGELTPAEGLALTSRATNVAEALAGAGYFGPFGIDGYRYSLNGMSGFCELGEINARYSMGFVTGFPVHPSELSLDSP